MLQSREKSRQQTAVDALQSAVEQPTTKQDNLTNDEIISGGKADANTKSETAGFSASTSHAESAPVDNCRTDVRSLGISSGNSNTVVGNCMDMSVDDHGDVVSVVEKPGTDSNAVGPESGSVSESCLSKPASTHELMDGSFRDELRSRHGDVVSLPTSASISVAKPDDVPDKPAVKTVSSTVQNNTQTGELVTLSSHTVAKSKPHYLAPVSFSDVAKSASLSENTSSRKEVNDSFAYRDQSAIMISDNESDNDDDDDEANDNIDKQDDKTGSCQHPNVRTETGDGKQKPSLEAREKDTCSKMLHESEQQTSKAEVSTDEVCQPSTVITIRLPTGSSVAPSGSSVPPPGDSVLLHGSSVPPRGSSVPPRGTSVPPHGTSVPSTGTSVPPQGTSVPPCGTSVPATGTVSSAPSSGASALPVNTGSISSNADMEKMVARREGISKLLNQKKVYTAIVVLFFG